MKYGTLKQGPLIYVAKDGKPLRMISVNEGGMKTAEMIADFMNEAHYRAAQEYVEELPMRIRLDITDYFFNKAFPKHLQSPA